MAEPPLGSLSGDEWADQFFEHVFSSYKPGLRSTLAEWFQAALDTGQHYGAKMAQRVEEEYMTVIDGSAVPFARGPGEVENLMGRVIDAREVTSGEFARGVHETVNWLLGIQNEPPL